MAKVPYNKALVEALNSPAIDNCTASTSEIEAEIAAISDKLKGPLSNQERLLLVADRAELRATLKQRRG